MASLNLNDEVTITGKILGYDPVTKSYWIGLKNINKNPKAPHEGAISISHKFVLPKSPSNNQNIKPSNNTTNQATPQVPTYVYVTDITIQSVQQSWKKLIGPNVDASTMETESSQKCDAWFLNECPQNKRVLFVLQYYKKWLKLKSSPVSMNFTQQSPYYTSVRSFIDGLFGYSAYQLLNDFHHLRNYHKSISGSTKQDLDDIYKYFKANCLCSSNNTDCRSFRRNIRDRARCRDKTYRRQLYFIPNSNNNITATKEMHVQNLLDTIHASLIHYTVDNISLSNKFVTNFGKQDDDIKVNNNNNNVDTFDDIKSSNDTVENAEYGFGEYFQYFNQSVAEFCPTKYKSLKEEFFNNNIHKLEAFQYRALVKSAEDFRKSNSGKEMVAKQNGTWNKTYGIKVGDVIKLEHVLVLMSYTNLDTLQHKYKKTYRKLSKTEQRSEITKRHQEIAIWAHLLKQCMGLYSSRLRGKTGKRTFYHGISLQLKFNQFETFIDCPCSATTSTIMANRFATCDGIILALSNGDGKGSNYINVSYLSAHPREEERLLLGSKWSFTNIIYRGLATERYVKCLKLYQKIMTGSFVVDDKHLFKFSYQNDLIKMMENYMNIKQNKKIIYKKIPNYLQMLFNHYTDTIIKEKGIIWINDDEFNSFIPELQIYIKQQSSNLFASSKITYGIFTAFLNTNNLSNGGLKFVLPNYLKWNIKDNHLKSFWNGTTIKSSNIKCNLYHISYIKKKDKNSYITFRVECSMNSAADDGRFKFSCLIASKTKYINTCDYEFSYLIPEIKYKYSDMVMMTNNGVFCEDQFDSNRLKKFKNGFTVKLLVRVLSCR